MEAFVAIFLAMGLLGLIAVYFLNKQEVTIDNNGITKLYRSARGGMTWTSNWGGDRLFPGDNLVDPEDPWFTVTDNSSYYRAWMGQLFISGRAPRMFVRDPDLKKQWHNVEITMYFRRVADDGTPYAGMVAVSRSNHGATGSTEDQPCDSRGYGGRMRYDGYTDFEKEISHPLNVSSPAKQLWPGGMPYDVWLGYKFVIYDLDDGSVKLELWLDVTDGRRGGRWEKVNELVDNGSFGDDKKPCSPGVGPGIALTKDGDRAGSESGKPNISTYFRSDNVSGNGGLVYKKGSVREITMERM